MPGLVFDKVKPAAIKKITPFLEEILARQHGKIHSISITGTAVTEDFDEKISDVNSVVVLKEMDLGFLEFLAPLGKRHGKHRVAAPLIMTPDYIESSLDVFPIEFLNIKRIHSTVFGADLFEDLVIQRMDLRYQCERELKTRLIWLRQKYISSQGHKRLLTQGLINSITGDVPLFRGILVLLHKLPPVRQSEVIAALAEESHVNTDVFAKVLRGKYQDFKLSSDELNTTFRDYYNTTEELGEIVDAIRE